MLDKKSLSYITKAVCKTIRSIGLSQKKEHQIENCVIKALSQSGPVFLLDRLSSLTEWKKRHLNGEETFSEPWFKVRKKYSCQGQLVLCEPSDPLSAQVWNLKPKAFFNVVGAIRKSILYSDVQEKQIKKWIEAVRCFKTNSPIPEDQLPGYLKLLLSSSSGRIYGKPYGYTMTHYERIARNELSRHNWFSVEDITGRSIPLRNTVMNVYSNKTESYSPRAVLTAYEQSINTCPLFVWQFLCDINYSKYYKGSWSYVEEVDNKVLGPEALSFKPPELTNNDLLTCHLNGKMSKWLDGKITEKLSSPLLQDAALWGWDSFDGADHSEGFGSFDSDWHESNDHDPASLRFDCVRETNGSFCTTSFGFSDPVGVIGFLQEGAGKLRTIANPHRMVQWATVPLARVFDRMIKDLGYNSFVRDQNGGILWAQKKLREGISLSSFDMSSATDRLDYKRFINLVHLALEEEGFSEEDSVLGRSLLFFQDVAEAPWLIPDHVREKLGAKGNTISWTCGQPLGLRPSFPLLTFMNCYMARLAIFRWHAEQGNSTVSLSEVDGSYACVGDDLIIESKYKDFYTLVVQEFNGKISVEKGLTSNRMAEFCSQLITSNNVIPLKPRFLDHLDGQIMNLERFSTSGMKPRVPKWIRDAFEKVSPWYVDGLSRWVPSVSRTPKPFIQRLALNALLQATGRPDRVTDKVTWTTLVEYGLSDAVEPCIRSATSRSSKRTVYEAVLNSFEKRIFTPGDPNSLDIFQCDWLENLWTIIGPEQVEASASLPEVKHFDKMTLQHKVTKSGINALKALAKTIDRIEINSEEKLLELRFCNVNGCSGSLLLEEDTLDIVLSLQSSGCEAILDNFAYFDEGERSILSEYVDALSQKTSREFLEENFRPVKAKPQSQFALSM